MIICQEKPEEFMQIYELVKAAFQTAKVSNGKEQDFVNQLRSSGNYIPELALVAEENGQLIGHIMLTKTYITNNENNYETLLLAPISVSLEYRNRGIGSVLINEGFKRAKEKGYRSVFLVGDPGYYHRFGFQASVNYGIKNKHNVPDEYVLAHELIECALSGINGTILLING